MTTDDFRQHLTTVARLAEERQEGSALAAELEKRQDALCKQEILLTREINRILNNLAPILDRIPEGEAVEVNGYAFWADTEGPALCLLRTPYSLNQILAEIEREEQLTDDQIDDAALRQAIADVDRAFPDQQSDDEITEEVLTSKGSFTVKFKPDERDHPRAYCNQCLRTYLMEAEHRCSCGGMLWSTGVGHSNDPTSAVRTDSGSIHLRNGSEES